MAKKFTRQFTLVELVVFVLWQRTCLPLKPLRKFVELTSNKAMCQYQNSAEENTSYVNYLSRSLQ